MVKVFAREHFQGGNIPWTAYEFSQSCTKVETVIHTSGNKSDQAACLRCGKTIINQGRGRPKKYCSSACKQRAYEKRVALRNFSDNDEALVLSPERAVKLHDGLFELRCSAEDIATAVEEEAPASEIRQLVEELVGIARRVEELR